MGLLRIVIAILLPPLGVFLQVGIGHAVLDQHRADNPRLCTWHSPCDIGYRQILNLNPFTFLSYSSSRAPGTPSQSLPVFYREGMPSKV